MDITKHITLNDEDIDDIITTALEGGINYWARSAHPLNDDYMGCEYASEIISKGGTLVITLDSPLVADIDEYLLTLESLKKGIELSIENDHISLEDIDASDADTIIQNALFGEVVFG